MITLVFAVMALCVIFIVVNLMDRMDKFMDANVPLEMIIKYYLVYLPEILKILMPVSILLAALFTIGKLSNNNEVTAMKSGGMSLYRILFPIAILGILFSIGQYYFNGWIVPVANEEKERFSQVYLNKMNISNSVSNLAFRDSPTRNVLIQYYDAQTKIANRIAIEDYDTGAAPRLNYRIEAQQMIWNDTANSWIAKHGIIKRIGSSNVVTERFEEMPITMKIKDRQLEKINKKADEMTFDEVKEYILLLRNGGKDVRKLEIEYHAEQALPLANFIVMLFAVTFASVKRRGGIAIQIAAAMIISFIYLIFFKISQPIGLSMNLPPYMVGWSANMIFFVAGIITLLKTRT